LLDAGDIGFEVAGGSARTLDKRSVGDRLARVTPVLERILIPLRSARRFSAMHSAATVLHRRRLARAAAAARRCAHFTDLGSTPLVASPADFGKLIADETEKWGKVVKFSGAKPD
jgi:hypothetical protein